MPDDRYDRPPPSLGGARHSEVAHTGRPAAGRTDREPPKLRTAPPPVPPQAPPYPAEPLPEEAFRGPRTIYKSARRAESRRHRSGLGRSLRYGALGVTGLIVAGATFLLLAPPTDLIRDQVIAEVKARTGRTLSVGSARLTLLPSLGVTLRDVTLSAPEAMPGAPLLTAKGLEVKVALLPLVTREMQVERLALVRPVLNLRIDRSGRRSWDFAEAEPLRQPAPRRFAQTSSPRGQELRRLPAELQEFARNSSAGPRAAGPLAGVQGLSLADVRIVDGVVRYADQQSGREHEARGIDARLSLRDLGGPLTIVGRFVHAGETIAVDAQLASLREVMEERPTRLTLKLAAPAVSASYDGEIAPRAAAALDGRLSVKAPSAVSLARLLQLPVPGLEAIGAFAVEGSIKTTASGVAITNGSYQVGELTANGALSVDMASGRPQVRTTLKIASLDLDRLAGLAGSPMPQPSPAGATPRPAPAAPGPAQSIEDLLKRSEGDAAKPGTVVRGFSRRSGEPWSVEPINLAALRLVDLDGRFAIGRLVWQQMKAGQTQLAVALKDGVLKSTIAEADLYNGRARGLVSLDARQAESVVGINVTLEGAAVAALLKDAAGLDVMEGRGRLQMAVSAKGVSERDLVGTLAGRAELHLADGAVVGWSAAEMMQQMAQLQMPALDRRPGARTPFSELAGTFQIANGVARTQDLRFESRELRATGTGVINLVDRNLDLTVRPKPAGALAQIDVPLRIAGNWDSVSVVPDLKGSETAKQLSRRVRDADLDSAARAIFGSGPEAEEKAAKAKELLKRFLRP